MIQPGAALCTKPTLLDTRSQVAIPLRIGARTVGVIDIQSEQTYAFTEDDISVLQSLADQVAVAIDNARSYELSQQLIKDLREVDQLKSQFLANMSHELRTPLNSIIGFSRVILKGIDGPITDIQQQDLTAIYNSGQHLLGLINDILDLARIEAGKMELNFEEVHIGGDGHKRSFHGERAGQGKTDPAGSAHPSRHAYRTRRYHARPAGLC